MPPRRRRVCRRRQSPAARQAPADRAFPHWHKTRRNRHVRSSAEKVVYAKQFVLGGNQHTPQLMLAGSNNNPGTALAFHSGGHSQAAPRTPDESPCLLRRIGVSMTSLKT